MYCPHYLVDKNHPLPPAYYPTDLVPCSIPFRADMYDLKRYICAIANKPLETMHLAALEDGIKLYGISAFRTYHRQQEIYNNSLLEKGREHTEKYIAYPGCSEHQTGLAIDLSCSDIDFELTEEFADTKEGMWLHKYAYQFGFILSYPKNNNKGYAYEPWHIRYACNNAKFYV